MLSRWKESSAAASYAYVCSGGGAAGSADGWVGVCRITRAFKCDPPTSVSEGAVTSGRADMDAIVAERSAIW